MKKNEKEFQIIRNGEIITLTNSEVYGFRKFIIAQDGRDSLDWIINYLYEIHEDNEAQLAEKLFEDNTACYEIGDRLNEFVWTGVSDTELEIVREYIAEVKEELKGEENE